MSGLVPVFDFARLLFTDPQPINVTVQAPGDPSIPFVNADQHVPEYVKSWDSYIGQEPMKKRLMTHIQAAINSWDRLPHVLLASGMPGVGKTTLARLIAKEMRANITMLVPPFSPSTLYEAAMQTGEGDILFIDEIHKLSDRGPAAAENLLHIMEESTLYLDDGVHHLEDFTLIGATTDADKLPEAVIDRFMIKPYFQPYSLRELVMIVKNFADYFGMSLLPETMVAIAKACRGTPRVAREFVIAARDMQNAYGENVQPEELLAFVEVDPDGMTRQHKAYVKAMFQFFHRTNADGETEYVAGEASMMSLLRENKAGIARLERFLIEQGLLDRTPRGRRLTQRGIAKAQRYVRDEGRLPTE